MAKGEYSESWLFDPEIKKIPCGRCKGSGEDTIIIERRSGCPACRGSGEEKRLFFLAIKKPLKWLLDQLRHYPPLP